MASHQKPPARKLASYGHVSSYRIDPADRSVIMTCFHPAHGEDIEIRVLPIELDTMLRAVRGTP